LEEQNRGCKEGDGKLRRIELGEENGGDKEYEESRDPWAEIGGEVIN
jgi:hypothetical protein